VNQTIQMTLVLCLALVVETSDSFLFTSGFDVVRVR